MKSHSSCTLVVLQGAPSCRCINVGDCTTAQTAFDDLRLIPDAIRYLTNAQGVQRLFKGTLNHVTVGGHKSHCCCPLIQHRGRGQVAFVRVYWRSFLESLQIVHCPVCLLTELVIVSREGEGDPTRMNLFRFSSKR